MLLETIIHITTKQQQYQYYYREHTDFNIYGNPYYNGTLASVKLKKKLYAKREITFYSMNFTISIYYEPTILLYSVSYILPLIIAVVLIRIDVSMIYSHTLGKKKMLSRMVFSKYSITLWRLKTISIAKNAIIRI